MEKQEVDKARRAFNTGRSRVLQYRVEQLRALLRLIRERQVDISAALTHDLHRVRAVSVYRASHQQYCSTKRKKKYRDINTESQ